LKLAAQGRRRLSAFPAKFTSDTEDFDLPENVFSCIFIVYFCTAMIDMKINALQFVKKVVSPLFSK